MVILGLILLILAVVVIGYVWLATAGMTPVSIDYGILNVEVTPLWLFLAGGITLAVATSGLWLMGMGTRSSARRAREVRELRRQAKESERRSARAGERDELGSGTDRRSATTEGRGSDRAARGQRTSPAGDHPHRGTTGSSRTQDAPILPRPGHRSGEPTTGHPPGDQGGRQGPDGQASSLDVDR